MFSLLHSSLLSVNSCKALRVEQPLLNCLITGEGVDSVMGAGKKSSEVSLSDLRLVEATVLLF